MISAWAGAFNLDVLEFSQISVFDRIPAERIFYCEKLNYVKNSRPELFMPSLPRRSIEKLI